MFENYIFSLLYNNNKILGRAIKNVFPFELYNAQKTFEISYYTK